MIGGDASFQGASFKFAILKNAKLTGGESSFQAAVFEDADLSEAVLVGGLEGVLLKNANCTGVTIKGSFHGANIDGTEFGSADLTGIQSEDLGSCYFETPPSYNERTSFPAGFNPKERGWEQTSKYN